MAKITDKFFNRIIEGQLELSDEEKEALGGKGAYELEASLDIEQGTLECSEEDIKNIIEQKPAVILLKQSEDVTSAFVLREATEHESSYVLTLYEDGALTSIYLNFEHDDVAVPEEWNASCFYETDEIPGPATKLYKHQLTISCSGAGFTGNIKVDIISRRDSSYDKSSLESDTKVYGYYPFLKQNTTTLMWGLAVDGSYFVLDPVNKGTMTNGLLSSSISSITNDTVTEL